MRFRGLPSDLQVGAVDLQTASGEPCNLLPQCQVCRRGSLQYSVCSWGHATCADCGSADFDEADHASQPSMWCVACKSDRPGFTVRVDLDRLRLIQWKCPCGQIGTLAQLRQHIRASEPGHGMTAASQDEQTAVGTTGELLLDACKTFLQSAILDVEERMRNLMREENNKVRMDFDRKLETMTVNSDAQRQARDQARQGGLQELRQEFDRKMSACKSETTQSNAAIKILQDKTNRDLETLKSNLTTSSISASSDESFFWFDFDKLVRRFVVTKECTKSTYKHKIVAGVPLRSLIWIAEDSQVCFGVGGSTKIQEKDFSWPLKRTLHFRLHDVKGGIVKQSLLDTFKDGKFKNICFEAPTEQTTGTGYPFMSVEEIKAADVLVNGKICFSVKVTPLE